MKVCKLCGQSLPDDKFEPRYATCKACRHAKIYYSPQKQEWLRKTKDQRRRNSIKTQLKGHGLTIEDYQNMVNSQGNLCALCGTKAPGGRSKGQWYVDHDHDSGFIRGLLCFRCNIDLGVYEALAKRAGGVEKIAGYLS